MDSSNPDCQIDRAFQESSAEPFPVSDIADREGWLRTHCDALGPTAASHIRFLLKMLDTVRANPFHDLGSCRPAENDDCVVVSSNGRRTFGRVINGRFAPHYPAIAISQWQNEWDDICSWMRIPS